MRYLPKTSSQIRNIRLQEKLCDEICSTAIKEQQLIQLCNKSLPLALFLPYLTILRFKSHPQTAPPWAYRVPVTIS